MARPHQGQGVLKGLARTLPAGDGTLVVGLSTTKGSLIPVTSGSATGGTPVAQVVTIGRLTFYRYAKLPAIGDGTVYALPSTAGTIVGVCRGARRKTASSRLFAFCERP